MTWTPQIPHPHLSITVMWVVCCAIALVLDTGFQAVTRGEVRGQKTNDVVRVLIWFYFLGGSAIISSFLLDIDPVSAGEVRTAGLEEHLGSSLILSVMALAWPVFLIFAVMMSGAYASPVFLLRFPLTPLLLAAMLAGLLAPLYTVRARR